MDLCGPLAIASAGFRRCIAETVRGDRDSWTSQDTLFGTSVVSLSGSRSISDVNGTPDTIDTIFADLPTGITAVGGWVSNFSQADDVVLTAFDSNNLALETVTALTGGSGTNNFFLIGVATAQAIDRVEFESTGPTPGDHFAVDDFAFGVPEPATLSLLVLGGLLAARRPRQQSR